MSAITGPTLWELPDALPYYPDVGPKLVVNDRAIFRTTATWSHPLVDAAGVFVPTMAGTAARHAIIKSPTSPLSMARMEFSATWGMGDGETHYEMLRIANLGDRSDFRVWFPIPITDTWIADGAATTFVLSRSTAYSAPDIVFEDFPILAKVFGAGPDEVLDVVEVAPVAGQIQISKTADSNQIVVGTVYAQGVEIHMMYYPYIRGSVSTDPSGEGLVGEFGLTIEEFLPTRVS